jgi:hypothetical protein
VGSYTEIRLVAEHNAFGGKMKEKRIVSRLLIRKIPKIDMGL